MKHLSEKTRIFVETASIEDRILSCRNNKWIGYGQATKIMSKLDEMIIYPKNHRMPNLLIVGDSNNGKTAILDRFKKKHESYVDEDISVVNPVVYVQAPPESDERRFYNAILEVLFAPTRTSEKLDSRYLRVKRLLEKLNTKVLIIDEIHHVLAGAPTKQRKFLNVIKHLANDLQICIVCAGTKLAFNVIQSDQQLSNRFEPRVLPRWNNDIELKRLLLSFETLLPLQKESLLIEPSMVNKILSMSDGLIGEIAKILELSSIEALKSGEEKITKDILNNIDFLSPVDRKKKFII